jgi:hypothetical protein
VIIIIIIFFCGTGVWTQGLHLEPLCQAFFVKGFFRDRVLKTTWPGLASTPILLISASWVARITGVSHRCWAYHRCWGRHGRHTLSTWVMAKSRILKASTTRMMSRKEKWYLIEKRKDFYLCSRTSIWDEIPALWLLWAPWLNCSASVLSRWKCI